jgi:hypothetical protein
MRDDRLNELLNAELDDELDAAGRTELERLLATSPEARTRRDELHRVVDALAHIKAVEPPAELRESVFAALRPGMAKVLAFPNFRGPRVQQRWVPYAGALAAGVALGAIGLSLYHAPRDDFDAASLAGTMADPERHAPGQLLDQVELRGNGLRGTASLHEADGLWVVEFDLQTEVPVEVEATYDGQLVQLQGFVRPEPTSEAVLAGPGRLSFVNEGAQRAAIYLRPADAASGQVRLVFQAPGVPPTEVVLDAGTAGER